MYMNTSVSHMDRMGEMVSLAGMAKGPRPSSGRSMCTKRASAPSAAAVSPARHAVSTKLSAAASVSHEQARLVANVLIVDAFLADLSRLSTCSRSRVGPGNQAGAAAADERMASEAAIRLTIDDPGCESWMASHVDGMQPLVADLGLDIRAGPSLLLLRASIATEAVVGAAGAPLSV